MSGFLKYYETELSKTKNAEKQIVTPRRPATADDYEINEDAAKPVARPVRPQPAHRSVARPMNENIRRPVRPVAPEPKQKVIIKKVPVEKQVIKYKEVIPERYRDAYEIIDSMKDRLEEVFYQYGSIGLQRLSESMEDLIDDLMNPRPIKRYEQYEKPYQPAKRPVRYEEPDEPEEYEEDYEEEVEYVDENGEPISDEEIADHFNENGVLNDTVFNNIPVQEMTIQEQQDSLDINDLAAILGKEKEMPKHVTEGEFKRQTVMENLSSQLDAAKEEEKQKDLEPEGEYANDGIEIVEEAKQGVDLPEDVNIENITVNKETKNNEKTKKAKGRKARKTEC